MATPQPFGNANYVDPFTGESTGASTLGFVGTGSGFLGNRMRFYAFSGVNNGDTWTVGLGSVLAVGWFGTTSGPTNQNCPTFAMSVTADGQQQVTITMNTPGAVSGMLCVLSAN